FTTPQIEIAADTNSFGNVCDGTTVSLTVNDDYGNYIWYNNGFDVFGNDPVFSFSNFWQEGMYYVEVSPASWPEISIVSEEVDASFFELNPPVLTVVEDGPYCNGDEINTILGDDGYLYKWYVHEDFEYTDDDQVEVIGTTLTIDFNEQATVTVVAEFEGCTVSSSTFLEAAATFTPFIDFIDFNDAYLCTDSVAEIELPEWSVDGFSNFQWYRMVDDQEEIIEGETDLIYDAVETGMYFVTADIDQCPGESVASNTLEVLSYLDRELSISSDMATICEGEVVNLEMWDDWEDIQWFNGDVQLPFLSDYEVVMVPMIGGGDDLTQEVTEFNSYQAKARHSSCPTGLKIESNIVEIRPTFEPQIMHSPEPGDISYNPHVYDSIPILVFCSGQPVELALEESFDNITWYDHPYTGADDYELGTVFSESETALVFADWARFYTARVEQDGCVGYSMPVLVDSWVFAPITVTSYGNSQLCEEGDSTLIHLSFPGNYEAFEWYLDGVLIEGETNDSIWATVPGEYNLTAYRAECPDVGISTGTGPTVSFFNPEIIEEEDLIFADPWQGVGQNIFQWFLNGEPLDLPDDTFVLFKNEMEPGIYTCFISTVDGCEGMTQEFNWNPLSDENELAPELRLFPNPTSTEFRLEGIVPEEIIALRIFDAAGRLVETYQANQSKFDVSNLHSGFYLVDVQLNEDLKITNRLVVE
ncbi:MAG: T9SS type A sorting domain-containing protein, partial [Bacteroidota bacterium]